MKTKRSPRRLTRSYSEYVLRLEASKSDPGKYLKIPKSVLIEEGAVNIPLEYRREPVCCIRLQFREDICETRFVRLPPADLMEDEDEFLLILKPRPALHKQHGNEGIDSLNAAFENMGTECNAETNIDDLALQFRNMNTRRA